MKYILFALTLTTTISLSGQISFVDKTNFAGLGGSHLNNGLALGDSMAVLTGYIETWATFCLRMFPFRRA